MSRVASFWPWFVRRRNAVENVSAFSRKCLLKHKCTVQQMATLIQQEITFHHFNFFFFFRGYHTPMQFVFPEINVCQ